MCISMLASRRFILQSAVLLAVVAPAVSQRAVAQTPMGTALTYQGELSNDGVPVDEPLDGCDFVFTLWDADVDGSQVGPMLTPSALVADGRFTVALDFGAGIFTGSARWLEIAVCCPPDDCADPPPGFASPPTNHITLAPRQRLTPAPYAQALGAFYTQYNPTSPNLTGGGSGNGVSSGAHGGTIGGGGGSSAPNSVTDNFGTVGGGAGNQAGNADADPTNAEYATVGGGENNTASGAWSTIGGGVENTASGQESTVSGGGFNTASGVEATVGGGGFNIAGEDWSTVGGGSGNTASGPQATIGGGEVNTASDGWSTIGGGLENLASGAASTIGGGVANIAGGGDSTVGGGVGNDASGSTSTVAGGSSNEASGVASIVPGGLSNAAGGNYSLAAGRRAKAIENGMFVWADSRNFDFPSATGTLFTPTARQFLARTTGGVVFVSAIDGATGDSTAGVELAAGGGSWSSLSSRDAKANVDKVDGREILERLRGVPITTWNYKAQDESIRHIGPMAQDFSAAFGVGEKETMITTIDADGVALAAIQGLYEMVKEKDAEIAALRAEMEDRIAALEKKLTDFTAQEER